MIRLNVNENLEISENMLDVLGIFPNPTKNTITLNGLLPNETIHVFDYLGKEVYSAVSTSSIEIVDLSNFAEGIYLLKTDQHLNSKIIKQ
jgi:hypothetical protein